MSFNQFNLDPRLLKALEQNGFATPTPIQAQAIPLILVGRDLLASAQTGTGKTAAFVLPMLHRLLSRPGQGRGPRALVLTPTRELAQQVSQCIQQLGRHAGLKCGAIVGGADYRAQYQLLKARPAVLVATPGRLLDHLERKSLHLDQVELLVLDEADRMLDMGFVDEVNTIAAATPVSRQTLLFSATLEKRGLQAVIERLLREPQRVAIAPQQARHAAIAQAIYEADHMPHKQALLERLLADENIRQAIVFTATKRGADEQAERLREQGHHTAALHGDMSQGARNRVVEQLRRGRVKVLIATDVAARGLDIPGISHVFNFDLPIKAEDYVHRIGRTGRGGAQGVALSLAGPGDRQALARIERYLAQRLERRELAGLEPSRRARSSGPKPSGRRPARPAEGYARGGQDRPQRFGEGLASARNGERRPRREGYGQERADANRCAQRVVSGRR
ncbi:MAG TPA: DEAD/DEAH box helicase [Candidatus Competibacteraceae bacterium]|nr:DEAD/DEAH box helicase [Candidatus Competibacteraceae bacterium]